jgi:hypothetical protein
MRGSTATLSRRSLHIPTGLIILTLAAVAAAALAFVVYALWPRWPDAPPQADAPELPIVIGDVLFRIPQAAIRRQVQRRTGTQERIELAFLWPSLEPSAPMPRANGAASAAIPRLFFTISAAASTAMTSAERLKVIYPRYIESSRWIGAPGLTAIAFRADTPYRGEDLFYDARTGERFIARCTRDTGPAPGSCLLERDVGATIVTVRFSRAWLNDWEVLATGIDKLIEKMQPVARQTGSN